MGLFVLVLGALSFQLATLTAVSGLQPGCKRGGGVDQTQLTQAQRDARDTQHAISCSDDDTVAKMFRREVQQQHGLTSKTSQRV